MPDMWLHHLEPDGNDWVCKLCGEFVLRGFYNTDYPQDPGICYVCAAHIYDAFQKFVVSRQAAGLEIPKNAS